MMSNNESESRNPNGSSPDDGVPLAVAAESWCDCDLENQACSILDCLVLELLDGDSAGDAPSEWVSIQYQ